MAKKKPAKRRGVVASARLAKKTVDALFVNGRGEQATQLVLQLPDGRYGGGWGPEPMFDRVQEALAKSYEAGYRKGFKEAADLY